MQLSYWERESFFRDIDIAVIGSGIVGLNAAWSLKRKTPALNVAIFERGFLPYGASTRNAGFACFGSVSELLNDLRAHTEDEVLALVEKRWKGLLKLRSNLGDANIDFREWGGYEVFTPGDSDLYEECAARMDHLNSRLSDITGDREIYVNSDHKIPGFGFQKVSHLIENRLEGQIDTGKMMKALLDRTKDAGVKIFTGIPVDSFEEQESGALLSFGLNKVLVKQILITTNGFAKQLLPDADVRPGRAQVLITKPIHGLKVKGAFHYDKGYYYFRNINDRLLLGGGRNLDFRAEETTEFGLTSLVQDALDKLMRETILPGVDAEVDMRWSGIMGLGDRKSTILKKVSEHVLCAVRMGGMGVAIGSLIGEEAADLVLASI